MLILWSAVKGSSFLVFYTVQWYNHSPEATLSSVIRVYVLWFVAALVLPIPIVAYGDFSVVLRFAFMMEQVRTSSSAMQLFLSLLSSHEY